MIISNNTFNINRKLLKYNILAHNSFDFYSVAEECRNVGGIEVIVSCGVKLDTQYCVSVRRIGGHESYHGRDVDRLFARLGALDDLHFARKGGFEFLIRYIGFKLEPPDSTLGGKLSVGNLDRNDIESGESGRAKLFLDDRNVDLFDGTEIKKLSFALLIDRKRKRDIKARMGVKALAVGDGETASYEHSVNGALKVKMGDIF